MNNIKYKNEKIIKTITLYIQTLLYGNFKIDRKKSYRVSQQDSSKYTNFYMNIQIDNLYIDTSI